MPYHACVLLSPTPYRYTTSPLIPSFKGLNHLQDTIASSTPGRAVLRNNFVHATCASVTKQYSSGTGVKTGTVAASREEAWSITGSTGYNEA